MKEKKDIDRLFQEKFKDFEKAPSEAVWNRLSQQSKKNDRKVIPLWWRLGGIAALLALLFTAGTFWLTTDTTLSNPVVDTQSETNNSPINQNDPTEGTDLPVLTTSAEEDGLQGQNGISPGAADPTEDKKYLQSERAFQNGQGEQYASKLDQKENKLKAGKAPLETTVALKTQTSGAESEQSVAEAVATIENGSSNRKEPEAQVQDALTENSIGGDLTNGDGVATVESDADQEVNALETILKNSETDPIAEVLSNPSDDKRWNVGAHAAPVYYGNFGGSGIDPQFGDNVQSGDVNMSYGVQVSYAVSPRFKVRTGVNTVDLSYNTGGISFSPNFEAGRLLSVNYNDNARSLNITDQIPQSEAAVATTDGFAPQSRAAVSNGILEQRIGYIEVPMEAVYRLLDKKVGIELVGGISTMILNNNEILLQSSDMLTQLGTSNSLQDISFTTNFGVGVNYSLLKNVQVQVEPVLKYQVNAFDNTVGDFKPYFFGVYTGVKYRF